MENSIIKRIEELSNVKDLKEYLETLHPYDIASIFDELSEEKQEEIYNALSYEELAEIFSYLDSDEAADYLEEMDIEKSAKIINEMEVDDAVDVINELDEPKQIVDRLKDEVKEDINELSFYEDDTAGSIMNTNFIELSPLMDVKDAMKELNNKASESEVIDPLFVCQDGVLVGVLSLKDLIMARSPKQIGEIMETNFVSCETNDDIEIANDLINDYDIFALPVLEKNILRGVITIDDVFDTIKENIDEDYTHMAATGNIDTGDSIFKMLLKRLPWLIILLALSLIISNVLNIFDDVIAQCLVLAYFQTMLLDMAGNVGTQSLAVTIQKMANDELDTKKNEARHLGREVIINSIDSIILSIMSFGVSMLYLTIMNEASSLSKAFVISSSMLLTLLLSGIFATILPLLLRKLKIDPAVASGPFITTLNDIITIVIYFNIAILILGLVK